MWCSCKDQYGKCFMCPKFWKFYVIFTGGPKNQGEYKVFSNLDVTHDTISTYITAKSLIVPLLTYVSTLELT